MKEKAYPAAILLLLALAAAFLAPSVGIPTIVGGPLAWGGSSGDHSKPAAPVTPVAESDPSVVRDAMNLISDGTFDAMSGPWTYANGTTGAVTASRDPTARARLGHTTPVLEFDSMDNVSGPTPWTTVTSGQTHAYSNLSQEAVVAVEGNGSLRDDVTILKDNEWAGALRDDPLPWNWSGFNRMAIWMDKATSSPLSAWVFVQDQAGGSAWGQYALVTGWYRYALDLDAPLNVSRVNFITIVFTGLAGPTATVYVDDIVLFNSTSFSESASVAQTFTKSTPTGSGPNSLRLVFDVETTSSLNVVPFLEVTIGNTVEWSETPVAGNRSLDLDISSDVALEGTGSFTLAVSLWLNRTGWEEASMTAWIDNVTLIIPGTLARITLTPQTALVPAGQTAVFSAGGQDANGNPAPLDALNWSSTIGQIVQVNGTLATFRAPTQPGTGVVSAREGNISGSANVTVDPSALPGAPPPSSWGGTLWTGLLLIAGGLGGVGIAWLRRSAKRAFRIDDLFLIDHAGLLVVHATRRRDVLGDEDILAGMLTAIMSFAQDAFQSEIGGLKLFKIGNKTVALERNEHMYLAAIGLGSIRNRLSTSLRHFLADLEERYGDKLLRWSGMVADLPGIDAMAESFARRGRYRRGDWKRAAAREAEQPPFEDRGRRESGIDFVIVPEEPLRRA